MDTATKTVQHEVGRDQARAITAEITKAVTAILEKHGLVSGRVSSKYGYLYSFKIDASQLTKGLNGVNTTSKGALDWVQNSWKHQAEYGFTDAKSLIGKKFVYNFRDFIFIGYNAKRSKFPLEATEISTDKRYKLPIQALKLIVAGRE